jgi:hypothetical protein
MARFHFLTIILIFCGLQTILAQKPHIRINQVGYLPGDYKTAVVFSNQPVNEAFELVRTNDSKTEKKNSLARGIV